MRAKVIYAPNGDPKAEHLWELLHVTARRFPVLWNVLSEEQCQKIEDIYQAIWLAPVLVDRGVDVIHAHFGSVATSVARLVHRLTGIPFIFTAHAKDIYHESVVVDDLRRKLSDAAAVVTVSDYNLMHLQNLYGEAAHHTVRIYNGLPLQRFPHTRQEQQRRHIVAVGRLVEKKGFAVLIDACRILRKRGVHFTCDIIGSGQEEAALASQIHASELDGCVRLVGPLPQGKVIEAMQGAATVAAPCIIGKDGNRDGMPTVLIEAMALGVPCVSTDVTGIPELVEHERTGLLASQNDAPSLADALQRLLDDRALRAQLGAAARLRIERDFDSTQNSAKLRDLYRLIANATAAPTAPLSLKHKIKEVA
ncbi:MAG: glycosyltransferase family 4 protein [Caldilinea sp.]